MSAAHALMRAVHERLAGDPGLAALIGDRLYDRVPDRAPLPYATYGSVRSRPIDAEGAELHEMTVDVWSRAHGRREAQGVLDEIARLLRSMPDRSDGLEDARLVGLTVIDLTVEADDDTDLEHAYGRFRVVTEVDPQPLP